MRPRSLPPLLDGPATLPTLSVDDENGQDPWAWVRALAPTLHELGLPLAELTPHEQRQARGMAAKAWLALDGAPEVTALHLRPELQAEFVENVSHPGLTLDMVSPASPDVARWRCVVGHEWTASIGARVGSGQRRGRGTNCRQCHFSTQARQRRNAAIAEPGQSLVDLHPDLAAQLLTCLPQPQLDAQQLKAGSSYRCRWRCPDCQHTWEAPVIARTRGSGCPRCATTSRAQAWTVPEPGQSLLECYPQVAAEFVACPSRPGAGPADIRWGARVKVQWRCEKCSHEWTAMVNSRTGPAAAGGSPTGCALCARVRGRRALIRPAAGQSLAELRPDLAAEFVRCLRDPQDGPADVTARSGAKVAWCCSSCSYEWVTAVGNRNKGTGCPRCARRRAAQTRRAGR